jgi:hypothetical protein
MSKKNVIEGSKTKIAYKEFVTALTSKSTTHVIQMSMRQDVADHEENERRGHADWKHTSERNNV